MSYSLKIVPFHRSCLFVCFMLYLCPNNKNYWPKWLNRSSNMLLYEKFTHKVVIRAKNEQNIHFFDKFLLFLLFYSFLAPITILLVIYWWIDVLQLSKGGMEAENAQKCFLTLPFTQFWYIWYIRCENMLFLMFCTKLARLTTLKALNYVHHVIWSISN